MNSFSHKLLFYRIIGLFVILILTACTRQTIASSPPLATKDGLWIHIPAGTFIRGSDAQEREWAYQLDETLAQAERPRQIGLYDAEFRRYTSQTKAYRINRRLVTQADYQRFVQATHAAVPEVSRRLWKSYGLIHPYDKILRFRWLEGKMPGQRANHPVVLVAQAEAMAYCHWIKNQDGLNTQTGRLPTEEEWEKAARGTDGRFWPWGNHYDARRLNDAQQGSWDTQPVGLYPQGDSPYGMQDAAGMVFEWTNSHQGCADNQTVVKGGSWDDTPGMSRPAARHCRPNSLKHILIGFRCVIQ